MSLLQGISKPVPTETPPVVLPIIQPPKVFTIKQHRITLKTKIPPLEPIIKIAGSVFAVKGDISFIAGPPKSGKTNVCAAMLASCFMSAADPTGDLLSIESVNAGTRPVIYIDTEQPKSYTQAMIRKILDLTGKQQEPENLYVINMREFTVQERRGFLEHIFTEFKDEFLYFIDGATDFISSVNDETESAEFINFLMKKSSEKQIPIICVMHENLGSGKLRGHLGSEAERKCGGSIGIRKDREKQIHWIEAKLLRGTNDFENVYFQWHPERKRFTLADDAVNTIMRKEAKKSREEVKNEQLARLIKDAFGASKAVGKKILTDRVCSILGQSDKTANRRIQDALAAEIIKFDVESNNFIVL